MSGHGWVNPNPDGSKARCGGPAICPACAREKGAAEAAIEAKLTEASSSKQQAGVSPTADCVFCDRIAAGQYNRTCSTPDVVVFEPLNPVTPGHLLIVPRSHVMDAAEDPALTALVFEWAAELAGRIPHASNLITSIGIDATQSVFHLHAHLVPRYAEDGLRLPWTGQKREA